MEYLYKEVWDYTIPDNLQHTRREYNKTILISINRVSMSIHKASMRGGADTIYINPDIEELFYNDWYDMNLKTLAGRYQIVFDNDLPKNIIKLENNKTLNNLIVIPRLQEEGHPEGDPLFSTINMVGINECSQEEIDTYKSGLGGYIEILNLSE